MTNQKSQKNQKNQKILKMKIKTIVKKYKID